MPCSFCGIVGHNRRTCQRFDLLLEAATEEPEQTNVETEDTLPHEPLDIRNLNGNLINTARTNLLSVIQKKAIVFILSDFIDIDYNKSLKLAAKKFDLTGIRIFDQMETEIPKLGFVPMIDAESDELVWVDTSSKKIRNSYSLNYNLSIKNFESLFTKNGAGVINCMVDQSYVKKLLGYFKHR